MAYRYPREAPHWCQATEVVAAIPDGSYVNVRYRDLEFHMCRVGWHDPYLNKNKSDVDVETVERGWLRIWFNNADVKPFSQSPTKQC
jgi:hypothetical protein